MTNAAEEVLGPIDYVVVEFPARHARPGRAAAMELAALVDTELIRVLDLAVLTKRDDGGTEVVEYEDLRDLPGLPLFDGRLAEALSDGDLADLAATLAPDASGMVIVYENTWAAPLSAALRDGGERIVAAGRIPTTDLVAALDIDAETA